MVAYHNHPTQERSATQHHHVLPLRASGWKTARSFSLSATARRCASLGFIAPGTKLSGMHFVHYGPEGHQRSMSTIHIPRGQLQALEQLGRHGRARCRGYAVWTSSIPTSWYGLYENDAQGRARASLRIISQPRVSPCSSCGAPRWLQVPDCLPATRGDRTRSPDPAASCWEQVGNRLASACAGCWWLHAPPPRVPSDGVAAQVSFR